MAENTINQMAASWTESAREAAQAFTAGVTALQERNIAFAKTVVEKSIEQTESQIAAARELAFSLANQAEKQRASYRDLARESVSAYADLLSGTVALYQKGVSTFLDTVKQPAAE